ncbi:hypothetical protein Vi05172_g6363 [Venturia inaequalis]|nr:hypothetical protein Vi05172_g6363 [Venturia inaequalis]
MAAFENSLLFWIDGRKKDRLLLWALLILSEKLP